MELTGRNYNSNSHRFGFQNQEKDLETNTIHFKYREYSPAEGKFWSIDPLASKYPFYSPYAFSGNRVIDSKEIEGLEPAQEIDGPDPLVPALVVPASSTIHVPIHPGGLDYISNVVPESGVVSNAAAGVMAFAIDQGKNTVSNVMLTTSSLLSGIEILMRNGSNAIKQEFTDQRIYPNPPVVVPVSLNESGTEIIKREEIMDGSLSPSEGAEILSGAASIVSPAIEVPISTGSKVVDKVAGTLVKGGVTGAATSGLRALDKEKNGND